MGLFITFEGGEGSGKSYQSKALYRKLNELAIPALLTHEPGGTILGEKLARLLKYSRDTGISPLTELLMFNTSRSQLVNEIIRPELQAGKVVICDRFTDSTIAYQHFGRGIDLKLVNTVNDAATHGLHPDLTFLLDVPVEVGLTRKGNKKSDRFETEKAAFHQKVRVGYLKLAANEPKRWVVIDACQPKDKIAGIIRHRVSTLLSEAE
jgi:dTMP kinase